MPIRMIMEPPRANGNDSERKTPHIVYHAHPELSSLRELRIRRNLKVKEIVTVVRNIYPRYDKYLHSKCECGEKYGVQLRPDAMDMLINTFAPELASTAKQNATEAPAESITPEPQEQLTKRKKDGHKFRRRVECRLSDEEYETLMTYIKQDNYDTVQCWLTRQIRQYINYKRKRNEDEL